MSRAMFGLIRYVVGLVAGLAGGIAATLVLAVLGSWLLEIPLDATNPVNWLFWISSIGTGIGSLICGLYLGMWKWKRSVGPGESLKAVVVRVAFMGALIGIGAATLWFEGGQIGAALLILRVHGSIGG